MAVSLDRLDAARQTLREERRRCADERAAFRAFRNDLSEVKATAPATRPIAARAIGHRHHSDDALTQVRRAYERTVMSVPHYETDYGDTFEASVTAEFGPDVAAALQSASTLSPALRQTVASAAANATTERDEFIDVLDAEAGSIESMRDDVSSLCAHLVSLDDTPLSERGFSELESLYRELTRLETRLDGLAATRQRMLSDHRRALSSLVPDVTEFLYEDLPVSYPALVTLAEVGETLDTAARRVAQHLTATP